QVALHQLEGDLLAAVGDGPVDLAEAAATEALFDGVALQGAVAGRVGEFHRRSSSRRRACKRFARQERIFYQNLTAKTPEPDAPARERSLAGASGSGVSWFACRN